MKLRVEVLSGHAGNRGIVTIVGDAGELLARDTGRLDDSKELQKVGARLAEKLGKDEEHVTKQLEAAWLSALTKFGQPEEDDEDLDVQFGAQYRATPEGLVWDRPTANGTVPVPLSNFTAEITGEIVLDDGVETRRTLEIQATVRNRQHNFTVPADRFAVMNWPMEHLGASAVVAPGFGVKDHLRCAVQTLSGNVPERRVYTHVGVRKQGDTYVYLHAGGALGLLGLLSDVEVQVPEVLQHYILPEPPTGEALVAAVRASLRTLELVPPTVGFPLLCSVYRAPLGPADFSIHLTGPTGSGKTEDVALAQQHYGAAMDARHLPGSYSSTGNALEVAAFHAKDALFVVDDFAPGGTSYDVMRQHRDADRLLRAAGNRSGRARLRADATLKPVKPPRCLILSTGEDVPRGISLRARLLVLEVSPGDLNWDLLTICQRDAASGLFAQAMSGYICWLMGRYETIQSELRARLNELRERATSDESGHRRVPDIVANLFAGFSYLLQFATEQGVMPQTEADTLSARCWDALGEAAAAQAEHQLAAEPTRRFLDLVGSALASGRAHLASPEGDAPYRPERWGWRQREVGMGDNLRSELQPQGERIGWCLGEQVYLEPDAAYAAAQRLARDGGDAISVTLPTLKKRLDEKGFLASTENRGGKRYLTVRRTLEGVRRDVLHMEAESLGAGSSPSSPPQPESPENGLLFGLPRGLLSGPTTESSPKK